MPNKDFYERWRDAYAETRGYSEPTVKEPSTKQLQQWFSEGGGCQATDGCWVEVDGKCPHGYVSWALYLGLV